MVPGGEFGHDTSISLVHCDLRMDRVGKQPAGQPGRTSLVKREAGLIAGGFDTEDQHGEGLCLGTL